MLRTTNKIVQERLRVHVLENFAEAAEHQRDNGNPKATPLSCLVEQIDYMRHGNRSIYQTGIDYAEGGSMLVYYQEQRDFLREILKQTKAEADKFSDDKVFKLYCHLVAKTIAKLYTERNY